MSHLPAYVSVKNKVSSSAASFFASFDMKERTWGNYVRSSSLNGSPRIGSGGRVRLYDCKVQSRTLDWVVLELRGTRRTMIDGRVILTKCDLYSLYVQLSRCRPRREDKLSILV